MKLQKSLFRSLCRTGRPQQRTAYPLSETCQIEGLSRLLQLFFGIKRDGFFVEFGAFDGEYASNASGLADFGWSGLFIEPVSAYFEACVRRHERNTQVRVLNYAVSDVEGQTEISIGGPLSSLSQETVRRFHEMQWSSGFHDGTYERVEAKTLDSILTSAGVPAGFDLLSVDVEGFEFQALNSLSLVKWQPKMVIVELHDSNENYPHEWSAAEAIVEKFRTAKYRIVWKNFSNTVFVAPDTYPITTKHE